MDVPLDLGDSPLVGGLAEDPQREDADRRDELESNIKGFTDLTSAVIGAAAGYLSLWFVFQLFRLITGREGMGYGDFKLLAVFGAFLGWQMLPLVILLSSLVGAVIGITLVVVRGRDRQIPIPFGPYLAGAGLVALFWGDVLVDRYLQLAHESTAGADLAVGLTQAELDGDLLTCQGCRHGDALLLPFGECAQLPSAEGSQVEQLQRVTH